MTPKVKVDTDQIEDAADVFGSQVATDIFNASSTVAFALTGGMAGNDEAGDSWSSAYDHAATTVMGATADLVNGSYKLASMLLITGDNHKRADEYSRMNQPGVPSQYLPKLYTDNFVSPFVVPPSGGAGGDTPTGWSLIEHAVGYAWPGGHQDKLRSTANAWGKAAGALDDAGWQIPGATAELILNESPEIGKAYVVSRSMGEHLTDLSGAYRGLQDACNNYAGYLDKAHSDAESELASLVEWTIGIEAVGAFASFFTFGGAEVPTQGVEAGRIAATAARIAGIIRDLISAVKVVTEAVANVVTKAADVGKGMKGLLGARLSRAAAVEVENLPREAKTAEELAEEELTAAATPPEGAGEDWTVSPARNGKGEVWQKPGSVGNTDTVRIMEPTSRYPNGYVRFYNEHNQPVGLDGKPGPDSVTHIPVNPDGTYPVPKGWPK